MTKTKWRALPAIIAGAIVAAAAVPAALPAAASAQAPVPSLAWQQLLPGAQVVSSSPNVADLPGGPSVVVGAEDGRVYAFHLADGSPVAGWPARAGQPIDSSPAVAALAGGGLDEVVIGSGTAATIGQGGLDAFAPTGKTLWSRALPSPAYPGKPSDAVPASAAIGALGTGGPIRATVGVVGQAVYSLDAATGATEGGWPFPSPDSVYSSAALAAVPGGGGVDAIEGADSSPGVLPEEFQGGAVRAFDAGGHVVWEARFDDVVTSSPVVGPLEGPTSPPEVVVGGGDYWYRTTGHRTSASTSVTALSASGQVLWRRDLGGVTQDSPALADLLGNGQLDVVEATMKGANDQVGGPGSGLVWALGPPGAPLPGWPVAAAPFVAGQVSTADLLGNGQQDVLVPTPVGLAAYAPNGALLFQLGGGSGEGSVDGHPVVVQDAPLVTTDPDGHLGITIAGFVGTTSEGVIQHYVLPGGKVGQRGWPMWRHDPGLTGNAATALGPDQAVATVAPPASPPPPARRAPLTRLAGANRDLTSVATSQASFPATGSARSVVLASDAGYPDALAGTPLAAAQHGPLLLTTPGSLDPAVASEISRVLVPGGTVDVLGGDQAVSQAVGTELAQQGLAVKRIAGPDRFATATAIATALGAPSTVLEATGASFADALSAGAAAARLGGAVLLTNGATQAPETTAYLIAHPGAHTAVGGPACQADPQATCLAGPDRFATSVAVAQASFSAPTVADFASGLAFPDALSAGAQAAALGGPVLLVPAAGPLPASVISYLGRESSLSRAFVVGGLAAVGADVAGEIG